MSDLDNVADILAPPTFTPSGQTKTFRQAIADGDWLGSIQIWLYTTGEEPGLLYQRRTLKGAWAPGKLDVTAAGYYEQGEQELDGLRELREELGVTLQPEEVRLFGRKINVNVDSLGRERRSVSNIYFAEYRDSLDDIQMHDGELEGVFVLPLWKLMQLFDGKLEAFKAEGRTPDGKPATYEVTLDSFPYNFDDYHRRMAQFFALKLGVDDAYLGN